MKIKQIRNQIRQEYIKALYFVEKYLLHEHQLDHESPDFMGHLVLLEKSSNSEPHALANEILNSEIGMSVIHKFGYVMKKQDVSDIVIKNIA